MGYPASNSAPRQKAAKKVEKKRKDGRSFSRSVGRTVKYANLRFPSSYGSGLYATGPSAKFGDRRRREVKVLNPCARSLLVFGEVLWSFAEDAEDFGERGQVVLVVDLGTAS